MTIKRKIQPRCKLPQLNWMPLQPRQVRGTVFEDMNDDTFIDVCFIILRFFGRTLHPAPPPPSPGIPPLPLMYTMSFTLLQDRTGSAGTAVPVCHLHPPPLSLPFFGIMPFSSAPPPSVLYGQNLSFFVTFLNFNLVVVFLCICAPFSRVSRSGVSSSGCLA